MGPVTQPQMPHYFNFVDLTSFQPPMTRFSSHFHHYRHYYTFFTLCFLPCFSPTEFNRVVHEFGLDFLVDGLLGVKEKLLLTFLMINLVYFTEIR